MMEHRQIPAESSFYFSHRRLYRLSGVFMFSFVILFGVTALVQNRLWPVVDGRETIALIPHVMQEQATTGGGRLRISPPPGGDGVMTIALMGHPFDAMEYPVFEFFVSQNDAQYQYRLLWKRIGEDRPYFHILNQPVNGVSFSDLSSEENWQGRIEHLGLVIEPLFPLGLLPVADTAVTVQGFHLPAPDFWLKLRSQWHEWFSWQPPRFGALNHLPVHRALPWYATPTAVMSMATLFTGLLFRVRSRSWLALLVFGSLLLWIVEWPQWRLFHQWATGRDMTEKRAELALTGDQSLLPVLRLLRNQTEVQNKKIVVLSSQYEGLRLYWHLLPENIMWIPALSRDQLAVLPANTFILVPVASESVFLQLLNDLLSFGRQPAVNRAGQWWVLHWLNVKDHNMPGKGES